MGLMSRQRNIVLELLLSLDLIYFRTPSVTSSFFLINSVYDLLSFFWLLCMISYCIMMVTVLIIIIMVFMCGYCWFGSWFVTFTLVNICEFYTNKYMVDV
eukprot:GHVR01130030.1.p1 GENE.GHVR01130030.1~~GHVR01130030.1.p1  ORF type:complete len:100 (+),score=2.77 GHVR01130030.1:55-354(+)